VDSAVDKTALEGEVLDRSQVQDENSDFKVKQDGEPEPPAPVKAAKPKKDYETYYKQTLLNDPEKKGPSKELKSALLYFEIYLNAYVLIASVVGAGLAVMGEIGWLNFFVAIGARMAMWVASWVVLLLTICSEGCRLRITTLYFIQSILFIAYILGFSSHRKNPR
jgi:hypothetical protein